MNLLHELNIIKKLAVEAGNKIMEVYNSDSLDISEKEDKSPLTKADLISNSTIVNQLREKFPAYAILTEEEKDNESRLKADFVWIIDPLDGTKQFISKMGEFTVNVALVYKGEPVLGVIYAPAKRELYYASKGDGAFYEKDGGIRKIEVSGRKELNKMILVKSRSHATKKLMRLIEKHKFAEIKTSGSSLKGCLIAKSDADVYYRFGNINEWDICAMDMIVREAKGILTDLKGKTLKYNNHYPSVRGFLVSNNTVHNMLLNITEGVKND